MFMDTRKYGIVKIIRWFIYPLAILLIIIFMFFTCNSKGFRKERSTSDTHQTSLK